MVFVSNNAPLVVLTFLGTCFLLGLLGLGFIWTLAAGKRAAASKVFVAGLLVGGVYGGILLASSMSSEEKTLGSGEWKYFCEIDCHVAYSITNVATSKTLGEGASQATAAGAFYVITVKTWFDEDTISSRRAKDIPLWPNPRMVDVVDGQGRRYSTSLEGQKALVGSTVPLTHPLKPGESYETQLVFDLPSDAKAPRLLIADWFPTDTFLIGHENSILHKKAFFRLEPQAKNSGMAQAIR